MIPKEKIIEFVEAKTKGRDNSHGLMHMETVASIALTLNDNPLLVDWIYLVAMLHDVADHKYDKDGSITKAVTEFLVEELGTAVATRVSDVIDAISFSKEKQRGHRWYASQLGSQDWMYIRDIVSDADKLEALGPTGFERCKLYIHHKHPDMEPQLVLDNIIEHSKEKLFVLDDYIRTAKARTIAQQKTIELMRHIVSFSDSISE